MKDLQQTKRFDRDAVSQASQADETLDVSFAKRFTKMRCWSI